VPQMPTHRIAVIAARLMVWGLSTICSLLLVLALILLCYDVQTAMLAAKFSFAAFLAMVVFLFLSLALLTESRRPFTERLSYITAIRLR
jgi:hypothetical protein